MPAELAKPSRAPRPSKDLFMPIRLLLAAAFAAVFTCAAAAAPAQPPGANHLAAKGGKHVAKTHARKAHAKGTAKAGHAATSQHTKKARTSHKLHQSGARHPSASH
jgi:hypothetical protein